MREVRKNLYLLTEVRKNLLPVEGGKKEPVPVVGRNDETITDRKSNLEHATVEEVEKAPLPVEESKEGRNLSLVAPGVNDLRPDPLMTSLCQVIMITKERNKLKGLSYEIDFENVDEN